MRTKFPADFASSHLARNRKSDYIGIMFAMKDEGAARPVELAALLRKLVGAPLSAGDISAAQPVIEAATPEDVAVAVDLLVAESIPLGSLDPAVSKLINLLGSTLSKLAFAPDDPFFASLMAENAGIRKSLDAIRAPLLDLNRTESELERRRRLDVIVERLDGLAPIATHYEKKENVLFPVFERSHPRWRCVTLMWSMHDTVRRELTAIRGLAVAAAPDIKILNAAFGRLFFAAFAVIFREERILFPVVSALLSRSERFALFRESRALGFAFLSASEIAAFDAESAHENFADELPAMAGRTSGDSRPPAGAIAFGAGRLSPDALGAIFATMPLDLTFVDADDKVAWFSEGPHRVFPRSPSVIGRDVRNCHPAASLDRVMAIVESFRSGRRDTEEFWIKHRGRFVHIRYFALRDSEGAYLGTLEATQDITDIRTLDGERRLAT